MSGFRRTPRNYDGTAITTHRISELLPKVLGRIEKVYSDRPDLILASWPEIIGPQLATMTRAISFGYGILLVKVSNSTLYSLLSRIERPKLLRRLQERFPTAYVKDIHFKLG